MTTLETQIQTGQAGAFGGSAARLYRKLDAMFLSWASRRNAEEWIFPATIPARELDKLDYFRSFPHLVTFPAVLDAGDDNLKRFVDGQCVDASGEVHTTCLSPIEHALTPAACYHFYVQFQGRKLAAPLYLTTRATCFRRESYYAPLQRQWSFSMREIVCIGGAEEVRGFLSFYQALVDEFLRRIGLPFEWQTATDPFFRPNKNPKYLLQKLDPVKTEIVFDGRLAIGSVNFHRSYFGETFGITRDGNECYSGCVAFGVERWIHAFLSCFGEDETRWPDCDGVRIDK